MMVKCKEKLLRWESIAQATTTERIISRTNVFLFTIASGNRTTRLKDTYPDSFPEKLCLGILDEAGATSETYIPLVMTLGIENLVLLGDVKQLRPLVIAPDEERIDEKQANRSLMERVLDAGLPNKTMLTIQYRMPKKICNVVS